eukprot:scpid55642/ scgid23810/ 
MLEVLPVLFSMDKKALPLIPPRAKHGPWSMESAIVIVIMHMYKSIHPQITLLEVYNHVLTVTARLLHCRILLLLLRTWKAQQSTGLGAIVAGQHHDGNCAPSFYIWNMTSTLHVLECDFVVLRKYFQNEQGDWRHGYES